MPETPYRHDQPADDIPAGHEHARLTAADQPNYPSASDRDQAPQSPPTVQASAATQADAAPPPLDPRRSAGATPQDAQDAAGQREAATPTPEGPPAATEEPATLRLRALAFAVDLAVVTLALLVPILIGALTGVDSLWMLGVVLAAGGIIYHTVWVWLSGQTPGKALFDLAVRHGDTAPARTWQGLLWCLGRHSAGYLIADLGGVGVLFALTQSRRCLHDCAFDSRVIIRSTGARGSWSLLARLDDYDKRLDASIEERGKWYAPLVSLWKKQTKLLRRLALVLIFLLGRSPDSPLGRLWAGVQRRIGRWMTQARSTASAPTEPLPAWARAGLWAVTGGIVVAVAVTVGPVDRSHARRGA